VVDENHDIDGIGPMKLKSEFVMKACCGKGTGRKPVLFSL